MIDPLIRVFTARDELTPAEVELLRSLPIRARSYGRGQMVVEAHSWPTEACLLLAGVAGREMMRLDGGRQVTALHFAGDLVDIRGFLLKQLDHSIVAMTDCDVGFISHRDLVTVSETAPHLTRLFWLSMAVDSAVQRAWMASKGRGSATEHLGHTICDLYLRLKMIGLASNLRFPLLLTQGEIADCLGLSGVQVNRSAQVLRGSGLIAWEQGEVTIHDWDRLADFSGFDPTYLNLINRPR